MHAPYSLAISACVFVCGAAVVSECSVLTRAEMCCVIFIFLSLIPPSSASLPRTRLLQVMLRGPMQYIAGGNSRDVFLIEYEGEQLVLKVVKHQSDQRSTRHLMEAIALDVVREG